MPAVASLLAPASFSLLSSVFQPGQLLSLTVSLLVFSDPGQEGHSETPSPVTSVAVGCVSVLRI